MISMDLYLVPTWHVDTIICVLLLLKINDDDSVLLHNRVSFLHNPTISGLATW